MEMTIIEGKVLTDLFKRISSLQTKLDKLYEKNGQNSKEWINNEEACMMLNLSKISIMNLRKRNLLPFTKLGGKIFYKLADIEALLSSGYKSGGIKQNN